MRICQNCKTQNVDESVFCRKCGVKIEDNPFICSSCKFENTDDSLFCIKCGNKLKVTAKESTGSFTDNNREAGYNQEVAPKPSPAAQFDYNTYMNAGSSTSIGEEKQVNNVNFSQAAAPVQQAPVQQAAARPVVQPVVREEVTISNTTGNSVGNIVNEGVVAKQGDWIYFSNSGDKGTLYKERLDGTDKTQISDEVCFCINVVNNWIYYRNNSDGGKLYKIQLDGTGRTKMLEIGRAHV